MRKAGSIVALIAGILSIFATVGTVFFGTFIAPMVGESMDTIGFFFGGLCASAAVIVLASIMMSTQKKWPGLALMLTCIAGCIFNWGGGFVSLCLVFALIGGIMALFDRKPVNRPS